MISTTTTSNKSMAISLLRVVGLTIISLCSIPRNVNVLLFQKNYSCDLSFSISVVQVPIVDHLVLLGVTIDNSLNFSKHIGKLRLLRGSQWGSGFYD